MLCAEFATDGEVEFAGADDGAVADGWNCVSVDRYDDDRISRSHGRRVVPRNFVGDRVVIFVDEIDSVLGLRFRADDFFAAIREFYNR